MLTSPAEIFAQVDALLRREESFTLATVIAIRGATSAKTGSKAIFDREGRNVAGWVGGGCAESFLARESLAALAQQNPRIVTVDLDDEVFGLMPCGGVMDVYLEPHFPAPTLTLPQVDAWQTPLTDFVRQLGYHAVAGGNHARVHNWADVFYLVARALNPAARPWRESKGHRREPWPVLDAAAPALTLLGQTRITEELCRLAALLTWPVTLYVQTLSGTTPPPGTAVCELPYDVGTLNFAAPVRVIVASHHAKDHELIHHALRAGAAYVGLVASEKRSGLIFEDLRARETTHLERYFAPAGLDLPGITPTQIAFAILCELLALETPAAWT